MEGKRLDSWKQLTQILTKPEHFIVARFIESCAFEVDSTTSEEYDKIITLALTKLKEEEVFSNIVSGIALVRDTLDLSKLFVCYIIFYQIAMTHEKTTIKSIYVNGVFIFPEL